MEVAASQAKKLTLCICRRVPRAGPTNRSATPVAKTIVVVSTTSGASSRSASSGGPFLR